MNNKGFLSHYGILGMRWGRRRARSSDDNAPDTPRKNSEDHDKKIELRKKKLNEMTNDELRAFTQRTMLEKQYKELTKAEVSGAEKFVKELLVKTGQEIITTQFKKYATKGVEDLLKKAEKKVTK